MPVSFFLFPRSKGHFVRAYQESRYYLNDLSYNSQALNGFLISGVDNHDTERRRQIALKALKDRLSKTETQSASESSNWPSLEDDISTSSTTANTSENKSGLDIDATAGDTSHVQIDIENQIEANREVLEDESDDKKPLLSPEN